MLILAAESFPNGPSHKHVIIMIKGDDKTLAQDLVQSRQS